MERRKGIITAAVVSGTLLAGAAGMTLSSGIVGAAGQDDVGELSPVDVSTDSSAVQLDAPVTSTSSSATPRDDGYDNDSTGDDGYDSTGDDAYEDDDAYDDRRDDDAYEHEGADDDD